MRPKKVEKKRVKPVASEGYARAGREGFGMGQDRPYLTRPRSSSGWAGGLFALRVTRRGHLEVGSFEALSL